MQLKGLLITATLFLTRAEAAPTSPNTVVARAFTNAVCESTKDANWWGAYHNGIIPGIAQLRTRAGGITVPANSKRRVTCINNSATYIYNDSDQPVDISSWNDVAEVAQPTFDKCQGNWLPLPGEVIIAHGFDSAGWYVLFRWDVCAVIPPGSPY